MIFPDPRQVGDVEVGDPEAVTVSGAQVVDRALPPHRAGDTAAA